MGDVVEENFLVRRQLTHNLDHRDNVKRDGLSHPRVKQDIGTVID
jgi:hypothetical protein